MELHQLGTLSTNLSSTSCTGGHPEPVETAGALCDSRSLRLVSPLPNTAQLAQRTVAGPDSATKGPSADDEVSGPHAIDDYACATDDRLIAAAKSLDARAFEELSGRHVKSMRGTVYRIVRNSADAEDVVQDSLLKAYSNLNRFKGSCEFSTWITTIAINTALMLLRKRKARPEVSFDQAGETDQPWGTWDIPDPSPSTEHTYARQQVLALMSHAVSRLPAIYRNVLEQYHAQEKSLREAADDLNITIASAKSRLFRARRTLRSRLEGRKISVLDACQ